MTGQPSITTKLAELRNAFDRERAVPFSSSADEQAESLLAIRVAGDGYAIRVSEISGITTNREIVALPTHVSGLLGIAGIRGALIPVYSLPSLLGYDTAVEALRWLALCEAHESFALAFDAFEGYLRISIGQIYPAKRSETSSAQGTHLAQTAGGTRAIVSIPLLTKTIQERCRVSSVSKER